VAAPSYPAQLMFDARLQRALDGLNDQRWGRHGAWRLRAGSVPNRSPIGELRDIIVARLLARCLPLMDVASRVIAEAEIGRLRDPNNSPLPKRPVHEVWADGHAPFRPALPDLQHDSQWLSTGLLQFNGQTRPARTGSVSVGSVSGRLRRQIDFLNAFIGVRRLLDLHLCLGRELKLPALGSAATGLETEGHLAEDAGFVRVYIPAATLGGQQRLRATRVRDGSFPGQFQALGRA